MGKFEPTSTTEWGNTSTTEWFGSNTSLSCNEVISFGTISYKNRTVGTFCAESFSLTGPATKAVTINRLIEALAQINDEGTFNLTRMLGLNTGFNIVSTISLLQTKLLDLSESFSFSDTSDWLSNVSLILEEIIGISAASDTIRFLSLILTASLNFDSSNTRQITFHQTLPEHISITDLITIIKTIALTCEEVINLSGVGFYVDVEGKVTITFQLKKGTVSFTLK